MLVLARVFVIRDENVGPAGDAASRAAPVLHIEYQALSIRENGVLVKDGLGHEVDCLGVHRWFRKIGSNLNYNKYWLKWP